MNASEQSQAAWRRAKAQPEAVADAAMRVAQLSGYGEREGWLADAFAAWPVPGGNEPIDIETLESQADMSPEQEAESLAVAKAAWAEAEENKTPAWRAATVFDLLIKRRAWPPLKGRANMPIMPKAWREAIEAFDPAANAREICGHLAHLPDRDAAADADGKRPSLLARVVESMAKPLGNSHITAPVSMKEGSGFNVRPMSRAPAMLALAATPLDVVRLAAIEVDGEPIASPAAAGMTRYRWREPSQNDLFPGPKTVDGKRIEDVVIEALAGLSLTGDERSQLRSDTFRIAQAAFALSAPATIPEDCGAVFIGGTDTNANRRRWNAGLILGRTIVITINRQTGQPRDLLNATFHGPHDTGMVDLSPPAWWTKNDGPKAWRLSGGLWRPALIGGGVNLDTKRGPQSGSIRAGSLHRTINGLEAALTWGPTAGRGKGARIPDNLKPNHKGGPGPEVFFPWHAVLRCSGEPVTAETPYGKGPGKRYHDRTNALIAAGFGTPLNASGHPTNGAAPAGDTIEIRRIKARRGQVAGLMVRASARFCEAHARMRTTGKRSTLELLPATRIFAPEPVAGPTPETR